jgi:drug/metabolite transporter (DMT)-like permease
MTPGAAPRSRLGLYALMGLHVFGSAGTYIFGKAAVAAFNDPAAVTLARALLGGGVCLLLAGTLIPRPSFQPRQWLRILGYGLLLVPVNQYCFLRGLQQTVPSHPALFYALTPLGVLTVASLMARTWPAPRQILGVALGLAGVILILRPWQQGGAVAQWRGGDAWILMAVASWVAYTLLAGRDCRTHDPRSVTAWSLAAGALLMLPLGGPSLLALDFRGIPLSGWLSLVWLGLVTSVAMMLMWNVLLRHLRPEEVAICANAQPLATALLAALLAQAGWLERNQDLGPVFAAGMLLVIAGVWLVQGAGGRPRGA